MTAAPASADVERRSRVLVVDDEPFNRDLLVQELEVYDTEVAGTGEEALRMVAASPPDLILLDVMMPGIDGYEVCRRLKTDDRTRFIPIVIMTALDAVEDRIRGIDAGADDFLTKPVDERQLMARIRTALRAKHSLDRRLNQVDAADHRAPAPAPSGGVRACSTCGAVYTVDAVKCMLDGNTVERFDRDPLIGRRLDRYDVLDRIGSGGMGVVYVASHATLKKQRYAIKIPFGEYAVEGQHAVRFVREAEACAGLDHPNIVSVLDFGTTPHGLPYMVMEYVAGRTLREIIVAEAPLPGKRAAAIARQMAAALGHAHARGLVHRDIKPANVIVQGRDGEELIKLLDFGVVGSLSGEGNGERLTGKDLRLGTPLYMAPELIDTGQIGPSCDLYAVGITLYEMLAGGPPYVGDSMRMYTEKLSGPPEPLETTTGLERVVTSLLVPDPADRPGSAQDVIAAIDAAMLAAATPPVGVPPSGPQVREDTPTRVQPRPADDTGSAPTVALRTDPAAGKPPLTVAPITLPPRSVPLVWIVVVLAAVAAGFLLRTLL